MVRGRGQLIQRYRQHQTFDHQGRFIASVVGARADEGKASDLDKANIISAARDFVEAWRRTAQTGSPPRDGAPTFPEKLGSSGLFDVIVPRAVIYRIHPLTVVCGNSRCSRSYILPRAPEADEDPAICPTCGTAPAYQMQHIFVHQCGYMDSFNPPPKCDHCRGTAFRLDQASRFRDFRWICLNRNCRAPKDVNQWCGNPNCDFEDKRMRADLHTASMAYVPQNIRIVNPPKPDDRLKAQRPNYAVAVVGQWLELCSHEDKERIIEGATVKDSHQVRALIEALRQANPEAAARFEGEHYNVDAPKLRDRLAGKLGLSDDALDVSLRRLTVQLETYERTRSEPITIDFLKSTADTNARKGLYEHYSTVIERAGIARDGIFLVPDFPVIEVAVGYSRAGYTPQEADLRSYRDRSGTGAEKTMFYANPQETEALIFRLNDERVVAWLALNGLTTHKAIEGDGGLRLWLARYLAHAGEVTRLPYDDSPTPDTRGGLAVTRLLHSMAHQFIRALSVDSGFMPTSLNEHFFPHHLAFAIYPRANGEFVIGGLRTVLEQGLDDIIVQAMNNDQCIYDPNCLVTNGADHGCLFLSETACGFWNRNSHLSRWDLFGGGDRNTGYWQMD